MNAITLFISTGRAMTAAEEWLEAHIKIAAGITYRIAHSTLRDEDGSIDQGFKCQLLDATGKHIRWL